MAGDLPDWARHAAEALHELQQADRELRFAKSRYTAALRETTVAEIQRRDWMAQMTVELLGRARTSAADERTDLLRRLDLEDLAAGGGTE